jgi:23S rRNA (uracil1939-C5)-methyltransferase
MNCRHHPTCPGCPLAGAPYADQLSRKRARLAEAFALFPHLPAVPEVLGSAWTEAYRHRLKLPVEVGPHHVSVGLVGDNGRVVDTPDCPVLAAPLRAALPPLLTALQGKSAVHSIDLRVSGATGELQLVLATTRDLPNAAGAALCRSVPGLASVAVSQARDLRRVMGQAPRRIAGKEHLEDQIGETKLMIHPGAFFQVDPRQAAVLHRIVRDMAGDARRILDLYCGVGAYARMLARPGREVIGVEEVPSAIVSARDGAPPGVKFIESKVEDVKFDRTFDVVILNPARRGSDPATLARLPALAKRAIYVSCGPETLARDLDALASHGMRVVKVQPIDLFPQTPEIETVVLLEQGPRLRSFPVPGGRARGPWDRAPSGATGEPTEIIALVIGDVGEHGAVPGGRYERLALVATHSLVMIRSEAPVHAVLGALGRRGHPTAGQDTKTRHFFAEKAGLQRPFAHVRRDASGATAPLHGDLVLALRALGAPEALLERLLSTTPRPQAPRRPERRAAKPRRSGGRR